MHLPAFCLQVSVSEDCFWQCYEGLQKVARKLRLLTEWQMPTRSSGVWAWLGKGEKTATRSIIKQLDAVMTHPAPSYEPTLFPWWSTIPIPAESSTSLVDVGVGWWHKRVAAVWCHNSVLHHDKGNRCICVTSSWMHDPLLCSPSTVQWAAEIEAWEAPCGPQLSPVPSLISQIDGVLNLKMSGWTERIY